MTDRPILFSAPMVRALLDGRKTQTRRVLKPQPKLFPIDEAGTPCKVGLMHLIDDRLPRITLGRVITRQEIHYAVGDQLYVREAWRCEARLDKRSPLEIATNYPGVKYIATAEPDDFGIEGKFRQAMHMPRWASRLTLAVTDVRVQQLQEISEEDANAEGCIKLKATGRAVEYRGGQYLGDCWPSCRVWYRELWDHLNAPRGFGWDVNPWVVAVSFTVERRNIDEARP